MITGVTEAYGLRDLSVFCDLQNTSSLLSFFFFLSFIFLYFLAMLFLFLQCFSCCCLKAGAKHFLKMGCQERTRWQRSIWMWHTSLSMDTSGIHLQTQKCMQNHQLRVEEVPDQWKRIYRTKQNSVR